MTFRQCLLMIGLLAGLGAVQVSQQTAIRLKAYALGRLEERCHQLENEALWLKAKVVALQSPTNLTSVMKSRQLDFVAWSTLPTASPKKVGAPVSLVALSE